MSYPVTLAEWESRFYGFPIGNVELPADYSPDLLEESFRSARSRFRLICVTLLKDGPENLPMSDAPCPCYDRKITFKKSVPRNVRPLDSHVVSYTSTFCNRDLERLAVQSGAMSRFSRDPELSMQFERLFLTWINYCVSGELADSIWTWKESNEHVGLVTIRCAKRINPENGQFEREGRIGMLAVDAAYRRRGIGTQLFEACDFWCSSLGIPQVSLVTQKENDATIALLEKLGFEQTREESVYHYWTPGWVYDVHRGWIRRRLAKV